MPAPPSLWLSDPAWCAMDPTARGFHAQLVLLAAQQGGTLPDDPALWRRWLGIPEAGRATSWPRLPSAVVQWVNEGSPTRLAELGGMTGLMEHYWVTRWEPMVRAAWVPAGAGMLTCPAASALAGAGPAATQPAALEPGAPADDAAPAGVPAGTGKGRARKSARKTTGAARTARGKARRSPLLDLPVEQWLSASGPVGPGWVVAAPLGERLVDPDEVQARWHVPVSRSVRLNLWTVGLAALGQAPGEEQKNRAFLSSLIQRYGERKVSAAVGEMGGRSVPPADPRAFLRAILRRENEGAPAAQQARLDRSGVPL